MSRTCCCAHRIHRITLREEIDISPTYSYRSHCLSLFPTKYKYTDPFPHTNRRNNDLLTGNNNRATCYHRTVCCSGYCALPRPSPRWSQKNSPYSSSPSRCYFLPLLDGNIHAGILIINIHIVCAAHLPMPHMCQRLF